MLALIAILATLALGLIGVVVLRRTLVVLDERHEFADCFAERFDQYVASGGRDRDAYQELVLHSDRMQRELGPEGIYAEFRPPYTEMVGRNVPIVLNLLPQLDQYARDTMLSRSVAPQYADAIRDALTRHFGRLMERQVTAERDARNPLRWFVEGVRFVVSLPVRLLVDFGLLSPARRDRTLASRGFQLTSGLVALVSLLGGLAGLLADLEDAVRQLRSLF